MLVIDTNIWVSYVLAPQSLLGQRVKQLIAEQPYAFSEDTFIELTDVLIVMFEIYQLPTIMRIVSSYKYRWLRGGSMFTFET